MHHRKLHGVAWVTPNLVLQDNGDILGQWNLKWKLLFRVSGFTEFYKFLLRGPVSACINTLSKVQTRSFKFSDPCCVMTDAHGLGFRV